MAQVRSPQFGYNHNIQHHGWLFHVQTEDGGLKHPRITTHLFHRGVILATRRNDYTASWAEEDVKNLMMTQHKGVLRELRQGVHDNRIREFLGEPPRKEAPSPAPTPASDTVAASWPTSLQTDRPATWEWREELHEKPDLAASWAKAALGVAPPTGINRKRTVALMPAVRAPRNVGQRLLRVSLAGREQVLGAVYPNGRLNGLAVQSRSLLTLGDHVMVQLEVGGEATMEFQIECVVAWKGMEPRVWGVEFLAEEAAPVRQMVLLMRGARRRSGPLMVSGTGEVSVWANGVEIQRSVDVTERGIFIPDDLDVAPSDMVPVLLHAVPGVDAAHVHMLVEWRSNAQGGGAGLRFVPHDPDEEHQVAQWVASVLQA